MKRFVQVATTIAASIFLSSGCAGTTPTFAPGLPSSESPAVRYGTAGSYRVLYAFEGSRDGATPFAGITIYEGNVFGTTQSGGGSRPACRYYGCGTIYELRPQGSSYSETVLQRLDQPEGVGPVAALTPQNGSLFGLAEVGGAHDKGTFFQLKPTTGGTFAFRRLFSFDGAQSDGALPVASLLSLHGALYGTSADASCACAIVYKFERVGPRYVESLVQSLTAAQGSAPAGTLVADRTENLYGTASAGGQRSSQCFNGCGTVFKVKAGGSGVSVLHVFTGSDGDGPVAGLWKDASDNLFGVTPYGGTGCNPVGCGVVFELSPNGTNYAFRVIYAFQGGTDGESPMGALTGDALGNLYGTTFDGGSACDCGTVFELLPHGSGYVKATLYAMRRAGGSNPSGTLVLNAGDLYGTATAGGTGCGTAGCGVVFRLRLH